MISLRQTASTAGTFVCGALLVSSAIAHAAPKGISQQPFGTLPDGRKATLYTLSNANGVTATITNYGGIVTALRVPDKRGVFGDVVLGYSSVEGYLNNEKTANTFFGALIGRYGNRIAKGHFTLDGKTYTLATNNAPNHLHGGVRGFNRVLWHARPLTTKAGQALELTYFSRNGEEGYPGNLQSRVVYTLTNANQLRIVYRAVTDAPTVVNLTHHSYFNLAGAGNGTILNHKLQIKANKYLPIDKTSIPLGRPEKVAGTPFDFRHLTAIGARINQTNTQLANGQGYDHNFVLNNQSGKLALAARVVEPTTGRTLRVYTTEPGLQFYSGNFLNGMVGKYGRTYLRRGGLCLEAQHYPDAPNQPQFPSTTLRPGQTYRQTTVYEFGTQ